MCFLYFIPHFIKEMSLLYSVCVCYRRGTIEGSIFSRKNVLEHCLSGYKDYLQAYLSSIKLELYSKIFILDEFSVFCWKCFSISHVRLENDTMWVHEKMVSYDYYNLLRLHRFFISEVINISWCY